VGSITAAARPRPFAHGFTLVEILVVLVIIAMAGALAIVTVSRDERGIAAREAKRFAGALQYAAARAQWRNETLGVTAEGREVRFWRREPAGDRWLALADDDVLSPQVLPEPVTAAALVYAGQRVAAGTVVPLRPSGRNEPYAFALATPAWRVVLAADPLNRVAIDGPVAIAR
jgi:type II secretion system protein H